MCSLITVIIPTRNRSVLLDKALSSLISQELSSSSFEVLVVDNGSSDNTADVVNKHKNILGNVRYFYDVEPGLHVGRHRGLKEACGEVLVYADDDIHAEPTWLAAIAENFTDPAVSLVGGNNYPDFQGQVPSWLNKLWNTPFLDGQGIVYLSVLAFPEGRREINPYYVWGCNYAIRKQVLLDAGGFHPDSMPQDLIRFRGDGETHVSHHVAENGLRCLFDSRASVYHLVSQSRMTFEYFRQRAFNQGVSDSFSCLRNPSPAQKPDSFTQVNKLRSTMGKLKALIFGHSCSDGNCEDPELQKILKVMSEGYREGYDYHQRMYLEDAEVRAWVHKPDYL